MRSKIAIVLASIIITLLILELGARYYLSQYGDERQKFLYLYSRDEINQKQTLLQGLAYLNYGLSPGHDAVNSLGYRGPEITIPKPDEIYRVVALGGSTTYGLFLDLWQLAYPRQLQEALQRDYGYDQVELVNAGVPHYSTWESAVNMLLRIPDLEPDLIIIYHGINDVGVRLTDPEFYDGLNSGKGYWVDRDDPLPPSVLWRFALKRLGYELPVGYELDATFQRPEEIRSCDQELSAGEIICHGLNMTAGEVLSANPPLYFERNLRNIIRLARGMNSEALLLTWAYSPLDFPIAGGGGMVHPHLRQGVDEHNAIVRRVAQEEGALFYDLAAAMPTDVQYWVNGIHMKAAGTAEMARQIAAYLAGSGILAQSD